MAILPGFEYDVFISYRQNDNRSGWVAEFVKALEEELAATIKEPLSIYFDQNPHGGLLENYHVDKSLEGKLKCLIFIPILSQTYCDPKSFAWQHEFCAFNKLAKDDPIGRDIKLRSGNVASRILPVKIHDLDLEDTKTVENETGGALRAIEFIFKSPGVNRPLRTNEDHPHDNLNKTFYRDQINKVANSIKEIITSIKNPSLQLYEQNELTPSPNSSYRKKLVIGITFVLMLTICFFVYQQLSSIREPTPPDKSVAVLPFADFSKEQDLEYLGDGVADEIINVLAQTQGLKVIARSSSFQFKGRNEDLREMGRKLGVTTILEGSVRKFKGQIRVTAQLINVEDGSHYWSKNMDQKTENLFEIQDAIAREVVNTLKVTLFDEASSKQKAKWNKEALRLYQQGRFLYDRAGDGDEDRAVEFFKKSVELDSSHAISLVYLAICSGNLGKWQEHKRLLVKAAQADSALSELHAVRTMEFLNNLEFQKSFEEISLALINGKGNPIILRTAAWICWHAGQTKRAVQYARLAVETDPLIGRSHDALSAALLADKDYGELLKSCRKAVELFPHDDYYRQMYSQALSINNQFDLALTEIDHIENKASRRDAFITLYYSQRNFNKLDSLYKTIPWDEQTVATRAEHLIVQNKQDQAVDHLIHAKMDIELLSSLRLGIPFNGLYSDARFQNLLKKYFYGGALPSLN